MRSEELESFLLDAASQTGHSSVELLARALHLRIRDLESFTQEMHPAVKVVFAELDYGLRTRNPGLHYVPRKNYLGYRRENATSTGAGERSQIFVSVLRNSRTVDLILPLEPSALSRISTVRNLTGVGHHGVGNSRVAISDASQLEQFFMDFDFWLRPHATD